MSLIDLLRSPWAIIPDRLEEIQSIYATHLRGEKIDVDAIEARLGRPLANEQQDYTVESGVGVLALTGAISPKANLFTRISGGASAEVFATQVNSMADDPRVRSAVLDIDSPGGNVLGIPAAADAVARLAAMKPTVTVCSGMLASAAYWIGSAANAVYASGKTDLIGSIGVVARHTYDPKSAAVQTTEVTAGKYKRVVSDTGPLTKEGRAYMQAQVDEIYRVFVDTVAQNRRVSADDVLARMADGRVFVGQQALDAGLIDGFATVDMMVARMIQNPEQFAKRRKAVFAVGAVGATATVGDAPAAADPAPASALAADVAVPAPAAAAPATPTQEVTMTAQELAAQFAAEHPEAAQLLRAEGASAEIQRITGVRKLKLPGQEALIERLAFDGKTTPAEAAMAVVEAEKARAEAAGRAHLAAAIEPVATVQPQAAPLSSTTPPKRVPNGSAALARLNNPMQKD